MAQSTLYRVLFVNQDQLFEVYARRVANSQLLGFVEIEEYVFGNSSQMLVDPGEEKLKSTFAGVRRSLIPMHAVVRIDEVAQEGQAKISKAQGSVTVFPLQPRRE